MTAVSISAIDEPLILQCNATIVRGISNAVDIIWTTGDTLVRRVNNVTASSNTNSTSVYNDSFIIPSLNVSDIGSVYQCEVLINSFAPTTAYTDFFISIPGMYVATYIHIYICMYLKLCAQTYLDIHYSPILTLHICVLACLTCTKLQKLVYVYTVVHNFGICMWTSEHMQQTRGPHHEFAHGLSHHTYTYCSYIYNSCRQWNTAILLWIGFFICCNEHGLKGLLKRCNLTYLIAKISWCH